MFNEYHYNTFWQLICCGLSFEWHINHNILFYRHNFFVEQFLQQSWNRSETSLVFTFAGKCSFEMTKKVYTNPTRVLVTNIYYLYKTVDNWVQTEIIFSK